MLWNRDNPAAAVAAGQVPGLVVFMNGGTNQDENPPSSVSAFASMVRSACLAHPQILAVEVGNEPYFGSGWSHSYYVSLLQAVFNALQGTGVKTVAAFNDNGNWDLGVAGAGGMAYCDYVSTHCYGANYNQTIQSSLDFTKARINRARNNSGKPVVIGELGWPTGAGVYADTPDSHQWTLSEQNTLLTQFCQWVVTIPWVAQYWIYNAVDQNGNPWQYGIQEEGPGTKKPSYATAASYCND
jgi:exo-beta-1,3-glucanase (GH17 family)